MRRLTAVMLALGLLSSGCGDDTGDPAPPVTAAATAPADTGASSTAAATSTSDAATTTSAPIAEPASLLLTASPAGVHLVSEDGTVRVVSTDAAAAAFAVGPELVVFQDAEVADFSSYPPWPYGPAKLWQRGVVSDLPAAVGMDSMRLLDAASVDGVPVALVAERRGGADGPDATFEDLVMIDLATGSRTTIVTIPGWESGHVAARLLPDGDVIGLIGAELSLALTRWSATRQEALWNVDVGMDIQIDLSLRFGDVALVETVPTPTVPELAVHTIDAATGVREGSLRIGVAEAAVGAGTGLACRDWLTPSLLVCGRDGAGPIKVSVLEGAFEPMAGERSAIVSVPRASPETG